MMTEERKKELIREAHEVAKEKGWWDEPRTNEECFALILSEACEALEADRKGFVADWEYYNTLVTEAEPHEIVNGVHVLGFQENIKDTVEDELADVCIRCFDLMGRLELRWHGEMALDRSTDHVWAYVLHVSKLVSSDGGHPLRLRMIVSATLQQAARMEVDLWRHIELKMAYNKTRPSKHGKNY